MTTSLHDLCERLRSARGMLHKGDIASAYLGLGAASSMCRVGDDCAAIATQDGYTLFAIEGLIDDFVRLEPWFAGYCGVMVNVSDIAAMGGRPSAVVDALWTNGTERAATIWAGMREAANAYGVPIVGGHTNARSDGDRLAVAILGHATRLLTSFDARPGDEIVAAIDLRGSYFEPYPYWNCSTGNAPERLRGDLAILETIANDGLAFAAKDISMAGVLGTLLMLLECSEVGAHVSLERVPKPPGVSLERWLTSFPSYGYLLAVPRDNVETVRRRFRSRDIACSSIGICDGTSKLDVSLEGRRETFWDLRERPFTGAIGHVPA